ncbi:DUF2163 domain-containing protein [Albidovulum sediminicola]|uniref:DUF2163 domain-containing protein n=1 Tax=Albidovulum sediminicola TaxID=2984331 RepID=A0ABT2Z0M3_9RHOB|nr:DUF2163 domain-containing protein [Defluviimonas sp. WL0075]MCV2864636.1 DUF2163 domain-containing protein [Defluviimonas sp. WL0075]
MSGFSGEFIAHLESGATTVARAFAVTRRDGLTLGFTDHDRSLSFEGIAFRADAGLTAKAVQSGTGLAVDNTEALGALSSEAITETDILAGRYDGAEVRAWLVNWADTAQRALIFRGSLGEVTRRGGAFSAELRGLAEALNQPQGRIYHARCSAILGDRACSFDTASPGYRVELPVEVVEDGRVFHFAQLAGHDDRWFEKGRLTVLDGTAEGLIGIVKNDRIRGTRREIELWQSLGIAPAAGTIVRIEAGCDKRAETCRLKFANLLNFQGFPDIPGEDWLIDYPTSGAAKDGGSLR